VEWESIYRARQFDVGRTIRVIRYPRLGVTKERDDECICSAVPENDGSYRINHKCPLHGFSGYHG